MQEYWMDERSPGDNSLDLIGILVLDVKILVEYNRTSAEE